MLVAIFVVINPLSANQYKQSYNNSSVKTSPSDKSKVFIREYTYRAGDDDSKNTSRKKAISQLKSILSEEVGTHIESSLNMETTSRNGVSNKYVSSEINSLSASITKLKIIDEKWNGTTYYIKASVKIDEEQTMMLLIEAIKAKSSEKDIKRLNKILKEQNSNLDKSYNKVQALQKKLILQEVKNQASKNELADTKALLNKLQREKQKYDREIVEQKSEITKIQNAILQVKKRIKKDNTKACLLTKGMTKKEIVNIVGKPSSDNWSNKAPSFTIYHSYSTKWYYGTITVNMKDGLINSLSGCR